MLRKWKDVDLCLE